MNRDTLLRQLDMLLAIPRWPHLKSPRIPGAVQAEVYEAVLAGTQLSPEYRARIAKATTRHGEIGHPVV